MGLPWPKNSSGKRVGLFMLTFSVANLLVIIGLIDSKYSKSLRVFLLALTD